jgi:hypothetical protein
MASVSFGPTAPAELHRNLHEARSVASNELVQTHVVGDLVANRSQASGARSRRGIGVIRESS